MVKTMNYLMFCRYGTQRRPWFCLAPSYWLPGSAPPPTSLSTAPVEVSEDVEAIPASMRGTEAIVIRDLRKDFTGLGKETVRAVQGVNLDIYPGQITAILGHNGAGGWSPPCLTSSLSRKVHSVQHAHRHVLLNFRQCCHLWLQHQ